MHVCGSGARNWRVRTHKCANFIMHEKVDLQNLLMVNMVQKSANYEEIKAKMVNTVFAIQFTSGCKFGAKGVVTIFALHLIVVWTFFAPYLP